MAGCRICPHARASRKNRWSASAERAYGRAAQRHGRNFSDIARELRETDSDAFGSDAGAVGGGADVAGARALFPGLVTQQVVAHFWWRHGLSGTVRRQLHRTPRAIAEGKRIRRRKKKSR